MTETFDLRRYGPDNPTRMMKREGGSYVRADDAMNLFRKLKETEAELGRLRQRMAQPGIGDFVICINADAHSLSDFENVTEKLILGKTYKITDIPSEDHFSLEGFVLTWKSNRFRLVSRCEDNQTNLARCVNIITVRRNATHKYARMHAIADFPIQVGKMAFELKQILTLVERSGQPPSQTTIDITETLEMHIKDAFRALFGHEMIYPYRPSNEDAAK